MADGQPRRLSKAGSSYNLTIDLEPSRSYAEPTNRSQFKHKDTLYVFLGVMLFLSVVWFIFVQRLYTAHQDDLLASDIDKLPGQDELFFEGR